jgi:hypothetical protein
LHPQISLPYFPASATPYFLISTSQAAVLQIRDVCITDPDPNFIHPGSGIQQQQQNQKRGEIVVLLFIVTTNFTQLKIILFFPETKNFQAIDKEF